VSQSFRTTAPSREVHNLLRPADQALHAHLRVRIPLKAATPS